MVTLVINDDSIELSNISYSLKSKVSGYLSDTVDRNKMPVYILPTSKLCYYVTITETLTKNVMYKVEKDSSLFIKDSDVDLEKIYNNVSAFRVDNNVANKLILNKNYEIIGSNTSSNDYMPYKLNEIEKVELTINNSYPFIDNVQKLSEDYFICAFPDILFSVDKYSTLNFLSVLVKNYVEKRFPAPDELLENDNRIISFSAFSFIMFHIKSILRVNWTTTYSMRTYFDNMSKMNLLPHIPNNKWFIDYSKLNLNTARLNDFLSKKESLIEKIKNKVEEKEEEKVEEKEETNSGLEVETINIDIPEYFSHVFREESSEIITWKDFLDIFDSYYGTGNYTYDINIYNTPFIIIPEESIAGISVDDIIFFGFDIDKFYMSVASNANSKDYTPEESAKKNTLEAYFWRKFGHNIEVVFDKKEDYNNCDINYGFGLGFVGE